MSRILGYDLGLATMSTRNQPLSQRNKRWLHKIAAIKLRIELEALVHCDTSDVQQASRVEANDHSTDLQQSQKRHQDLKNRATKAHPFTEDEAWNFIVDQRCLQNLQTAYNYCSNAECLGGINYVVEMRRRLSAPFVKWAMQLAQSTLPIDITEFDRLSEILDSVELQLSVLGLFNDMNTVQYEDYQFKRTSQPNLAIELRRQINERITKAATEKASKATQHTRSPLQHHQDNLRLQAFTSIILLGCIYPLYEAMRKSSSTHGSTADSDFFQHIINATVLFAGFVTLLIPVYRETAAKEWVGTWILISIGVLSGFLPILLWPLVPGMWSALFSGLASAAQLLVVLQVASAANFHGREHLKQN